MQVFHQIAHLLRVQLSVAVVIGLLEGLSQHFHVRRLVAVAREAPRDVDPGQSTHTCKSVTMSANDGVLDLARLVISHEFIF